MKVALITGITGQDGSYLAELLLEKGYIVHGILRRSSSINTVRIDHIFNSLKLCYGDVTDATSIMKIIGQLGQQYSGTIEIYNLAAQSHVRVSFDVPEYTMEVDAGGTLKILEAIKNHNLTDRVKFYQASTSELFGKVQEVPQSETTPFYPRSPYAVAKQYSYWIVKHYREAYGMFTCNGILFNHESPRRGETFVTRKITIGLSKIKKGLQECLYLGNLDSLRDWGHAKDYVRGMWLMLQHDVADDFVLATGKQYSVRYFVEKTCEYLDMDLEWSGEGLDEIGTDRKTGNVIIRINPVYFRPTEVDTLLGNPMKAQEVLNWKNEIGIDDLIKDMVEYDINCAEGLNSQNLT